MDVELYLIDRGGRLVDCNDVAKSMLDDQRGLSVGGGRLVATDPEAKKSLQRILSAASNGLLEATDSFTVGCDETKRRLIVLPLNGGGGSLRLAIIGETRKPLDGNLATTLRAAFGLSPIEAAIMIRLANGEGPKEISASRSVRQETTRTQYRSAMRKMDCRSLTDAIIAVRRLPSVRA